MIILAEIISFVGLVCVCYFRCFCSQPQADSQRAAFLALPHRLHVFEPEVTTWREQTRIYTYSYARENN